MGMPFTTAACSSRSCGNARPCSLQRIEELLVLVRRTNSHAERIGRTPASAHGTNDDSVLLQFLTKARGFFSHSAEEKVRPRGRHADPHFSDGLGQQLRTNGMCFNRASNVASIRQCGQSCCFGERRHHERRFHAREVTKQLRRSHSIAYAQTSQPVRLRESAQHNNRTSLPHILKRV